VIFKFTKRGLERLRLHLGNNLNANLEVLERKTKEKVCSIHSKEIRTLKSSSPSFRVQLPLCRDSQRTSITSMLIVHYNFLEPKVQLVQRTKHCG
jgi:hypothetical protein